MSFTEIRFLSIFLPLSLLISYFSGKRFREIVHLAISLVFYAMGSLHFLPLLLISAGINVLVGRLIAGIEKKEASKLFLFTIGVSFDLLVLASFKYGSLFSRMPVLSLVFNDIGTESGLPLGLSFYTFRAISYLADIYKGRIILSKSHMDFLYLCFFAQIQSGPIARYKHFEPEITFDRFSEGVYRFMTGFAKKVLLADVLAKITGEIYASPIERIGIRIAWLGAVCYALQLYYDFSGYSDMAIGLSAMFGYYCPENFRYPYISASFSEFWRRWHITLGSWFRDYVYIPLGGGRVKSRKRHYFNLLTVWILTGMWHGSTWNFLVWGMAYFVLISLEKTLDLPARLHNPVSRLLYRIFVIAMVVILWIPFKADSLDFAWKFILRMFTLNKLALQEPRAEYLLKDYWSFIFVAIVLCFPLVPALEIKLSKSKITFYAFETGLMIITAFFFVWGLSQVVAGAYNPFTYANF